MNSVHEQCPNSDLNSVQVATLVQVATSHWPTQVATPRDVATSFPSQAEQARSRLQNDVATPSSTGQVATSIQCRDIKSMSRPQFPTGQVATSIPCCDLPYCRPCRDINLCCDAVSAQPKQTRSRLQFHVATSWRLTYVATSTSCCDLQLYFPGHNMNFMSRPRTLQSLPQPGRNTKRMSRHQLLQSSFCIAMFFFFLKIFQ